MKTPQYHPETLSVRAGSEATEFGENSEALFLNSSFRFKMQRKQLQGLAAQSQVIFIHVLPILPSLCFKIN